MKGLSRYSASTYRFSVTDEKTGKSSETTVERYFSDRYKINLRYFLCCVFKGGKCYLNRRGCELKRMVGEGKGGRERGLGDSQWCKHSVEC